MILLQYVAFNYGTKMDVDIKNGAVITFKKAFQKHYDELRDKSGTFVSVNRLFYYNSLCWFKQKT